MDVETRVAGIIAQLAELTVEERFQIIPLLEGELDTLMRETQREDEGG